MSGIPQVDEFLERKCQDFSKPICEALRDIYLSEGLIEEFKWSAPCYSHHGIVCTLGAFKKHVASWFMKGVLLHDPDKILRKAQKDTKGLRSLYYTDISEVDEQVVRDFVKQAMLLNEQGIKVPKIGKPKELLPPDYMMARLKTNAKAIATFEHMSRSQRNDFINWITEAKREATRERRILQMLELLEEGKDRHHKYRK